MQHDCTSQLQHKQFKHKVYMNKELKERVIENMQMHIHKIR